VTISCFPPPQAQGFLQIWLIFVIPPVTGLFGILAFFFLASGSSTSIPLQLLQKEQIDYGADYKAINPDKVDIKQRTQFGWWVVLHTFGKWN